MKSSLGPFVIAGTGGLFSPRSLAFGPDGHLYVSSATGEILKYNGSTGAFIGGTARNKGLVHSLQKAIGGPKLYIPDDPEYVGALGAAMIAADAAGNVGGNRP